jgi:hypothetical protein
LLGSKEGEYATSANWSMETGVEVVSTAVVVEGMFAKGKTFSSKMTSREI